MIPLVIVMIDKCADFLFECALSIVIIHPRAETIVYHAAPSRYLLRAELEIIRPEGHTRLPCWVQFEVKISLDYAVSSRNQSFQGANMLKYM